MEVQRIIVRTEESRGEDKCPLWSLPTPPSSSVYSSFIYHMIIYQLADWLSRWRQNLNSLRSLFTSYCLQKSYLSLYICTSAGTAVTPTIPLHPPPWGSVKYFWSNSDSFRTNSNMEMDHVTQIIMTAHSLRPGLTSVTCMADTLPVHKWWIHLKHIMCTWNEITCRITAVPGDWLHLLTEQRLRAVWYRHQS